MRSSFSRIALVYDKVNTWGGAERVLLVLHEIFPEAPLYTSVYKSDSDDTSWTKVFPQVMPSFLQKFPFAPTHNQWYTSLMPLAFESLSFDEYDIVISVTSGEAKGIITKPHTLHLCYCLTPTRYLWSDPGYQSYHFNLLNSLVHFIKAPFLHYSRSWDQIAAQRPDYYATISRTTQNRINKYYHREAEVIYPPVDTEFFKPTTNHKRLTTDNYFLVVSRLAAYKKVDLAIEACRILNLPLVVVGTGPEYVHLNRNVEMLRSYNRIKFLGQVSDQKLLTLYQNCQALIMPQEEDFGLVALEVQACGKPVIAYQRGGATETVAGGKTGLFFPEQSVDSLVAMLKKFNKKKFSPEACRQQALKFSLEKFKKQFAGWVTERYKKHKQYDKM